MMKKPNLHLTIKPYTYESMHAQRHKYECLNIILHFIMFD